MKQEYYSLRPKQEATIDQIPLIQDRLRQGGMRTFRDELAPKHPLETSLKNMDEHKKLLKEQMSRDLYGLHMVFRMRMEEAIVGQIQRIPVLPSSNIAMDVLNGTDTEFDFTDFLNDPMMNTATMDVHEIMEAMI